ncbi:MAG: hypothetical protein QXZ70_01760 [Candidatus Bathyarchaeia archaeon]
MGTVPEAYYQFIMDYAPYVYVIPPNIPDPEWGRAAFAAAAMWYFASQMNSATASVQSFNEAVAEMPERGRSIRRAGEEEYYRRGIED